MEQHVSAQPKTLVFSRALPSVLKKTNFILIRKHTSPFSLARGIICPSGNVRGTKPQLSPYSWWSALQSQTTMGLQPSSSSPSHTRGATGCLPISQAKQGQWAHQRTTSTQWANPEPHKCCRGQRLMCRVTCLKLKKVDSYCPAIFNSEDVSISMFALKRKYAKDR